MAIATPPAGGTLGEVQDASRNPALNDRSFARGKAAAGPNPGVMTAAGAYTKTLLLTVILCLGAWFGWSQVQVIEFAGRTVAIQPGWTWFAFLAVIVLGFMGIVAFRAIPVIAVLYCLAYGALLGVASRYFNLEWDGIVAQAVLTTLLVFVATLLLYLTGVIKVTSKFVMGIAIAMGGLLLFYLATWLLSLLGVRFAFLSQPTPLGIAFSLGVVILAALNLPVDFEYIKRASAAGAPKFMEWYGAFGLMLSIIWMYVSILRLLALLRMARR